MSQDNEIRTQSEASLACFIYVAGQSQLCGQHEHNKVSRAMLVGAIRAYEQLLHNGDARYAVVSEILSRIEPDNATRDRLLNEYVTSFETFRHLPEGNSQPASRRPQRVDPEPATEPIKQVEDKDDADAEMNPFKRFYRRMCDDPQPKAPRHTPQHTVNRKEAA